MYLFSSFQITKLMLKLNIRFSNGYLPLRLIDRLNFLINYLRVLKDLAFILHKQLVFLYLSDYKHYISVFDLAHYNNCRHHKHNEIHTYISYL